MPLDLGSILVVETITVCLYEVVTEDGVNRRRENGTQKLEGYHVQYGSGGSLLEPGGLRSDSSPTLYGPDTNLIQAGTQIIRDRTGERFRVNHVAHEIEWLVAAMDNIA